MPNDGCGSGPEIAPTSPASLRNTRNKVRYDDTMLPTPINCLDRAGLHLAMHAGCHGFGSIRIVVDLSRGTDRFHNEQQSVRIDLGRLWLEQLGYGRHEWHGKRDGWRNGWLKHQIGRAHV